MRIVAKKRDYYDCVQGCAQDRSVAYIREEAEEWADNPFPKLGASYGGLSPTVYIIGFCGKIYPLIEMSYTDRTDRKHPVVKKVFCYSIHEVDAFVDAHANELNQTYYWGKDTKEFRRRNRCYGFPTRRWEVKGFFEECNRRQDSFRGIFEERRCPIFVVQEKREWDHDRKCHWTFNGMLRPFDFARIFDPYMAFQEIEMFLNNLAIPEKEMPKIPDEIKLRSKGFTDQSFRADFRDPYREPK